MKRLLFTVAVLVVLWIAFTPHNGKTTLAAAPDDVQAMQQSQGPTLGRPYSATNPVMVNMVVQGVDLGGGTRGVEPWTQGGGAIDRPVTGMVAAVDTTTNTALIVVSPMASCLFTNTPVQGHTAIPDPVNAGWCLDLATNRTGILNTKSLVGSITEVVTNTGCALATPCMAKVTLFGPAQYGDLVAAATMDGASMPAYIQANQTPQVQPDWNATTGLAAILNKPTLTGGTVTAVTGTAPIVSSGGTTPALSCPTCAVRLTGTTGSIGGTLLALGACATGTASVTGAAIGNTFRATPADGSFIGGNYTLNTNVAATGVVTVNLCAVIAGTPPAKTYNVER